LTKSCTPMKAQEPHTPHNIRRGDGERSAHEHRTREHHLNKHGVERVAVARAASSAKRWRGRTLHTVMGGKLAPAVPRRQTRAQREPEAPGNHAASEAGNRRSRRERPAVALRSINLPSAGATGQARQRMLLYRPAVAMSHGRLVQESRIAQPAHAIGKRPTTTRVQSHRASAKSSAYALSEITGILLH